MTTVLLLSGVSFLVLSVALRLVQRQERSRGPYAKFVKPSRRRMTFVKPSGTHFYGKNDDRDAA